jgi:hypothetical protein
VKIVFDYKIFFWQRYGGISTYFSNLAKNLIALNNEVKINDDTYIIDYLIDIPIFNLY